MLTRALTNKLATEQSLTPVVGVGNQHSTMSARYTSSEVSFTTKALRMLVKFKSAEKAGQAYMKMRSTPRGRALWDTYKLGKRRERIVLFSMEEMCDAAIGTWQSTLVCECYACLCM